MTYSQWVGSRICLPTGSDPGPATGERAFVQVKSRADQAVLDDYLKRFEVDPGWNRMFFACHTPIGALNPTASRPVHIWASDTLAYMVIKAGLYDWLIERSG